MEYVRLRYPSGSGEVPLFQGYLGFENPAAWPYIICEHLPGMTLDKRWFDIGENALKEVIHDIESDFPPGKFLTTWIYILCGKR